MSGNYKKDMVINRDKLKAYANLLDEAIKSHLGESEDVDFLANFPALNQALEDAKMEIVLSPRELGLRRWHMDSNIQSFPDVSHRLAQFCLLLEGWDLPDDEL